MRRLGGPALCLALGMFGTLLLALAIAGCANVKDLLRGTAATATIAAGGYRALDAADADKQTAIVAQAVSDPRAARAALEAWLGIYNKARAALDAGDDLVNGAYKAMPSLEGVLADRKAIAHWIELLTQAATSIAAALADAGVANPISTGGP